MREIKIRHSEFKVKVDDEDYEYLNQFNWFLKCGSGNYAMRAKRRGGGKRDSILMHRDIMGLTRGDGKIVDHKDRDGMNNQKDNLRLTSPKLNNANKTKRKNATSQYLGVCQAIRNNGKYKFWQVRVDGNYIGIFKNEIDAAKAYNEHAQKSYGEFANPNVL